MPPNYSRRFHTNDTIHVNLVAERMREYEQLLASRRTEDQQLRAAIVQAVDILKETPEAGKHIASDRIPKEYTRRYWSWGEFLEIRYPRELAAHLYHWS